MKDIFEAVTLTWDGQDYTVPPERCMRLAYKVEVALVQDSRRSVFEILESPLMTTLAMAYGAALRFAGAVVTDEEVYLVVARGMTGEVDAIEMMHATLDGVIAMLLPPAALARGASDDEKKISGA